MSQIFNMDSFLDDNVMNADEIARCKEFDYKPGDQIAITYDRGSKPGTTRVVTFQVRQVRRVRRAQTVN